MKWFWQRDEHTKKPKREKTIPEGAIRRKLRYTGRVQAVGFRFTAQSWAKERGVTGWVKNLPDGDVALEVQGTPEQVEGFLSDVAAESQRKGAFIHAILIENEPLEPIPDDRFVMKNLD